MADAVATTDPRPAGPAAAAGPGDAAPRAAPRPPPRVRGFQAAVSTAILLSYLAVVLASDRAARSEPVNQWFAERQAARAARNDELYADVGAYADLGDRLLLYDLPRADYARGGVYVLGSSTGTYCFDAYRLPPDRRALIHNFGLNGANHTQVFQFVRFLNDQEHFLSAGGERTMVILGLTYLNVVEPDRGHARFMPDYFGRFGVYRYDPAAGITAAPMTDAERWVRTVCWRSRSLLLHCWRGAGQIHRQPIDVAEFRRRNVDRLGPDWRPVLDRQMVELEATLDYLCARRATVVGLLIPEGSWNVGVPPREAFRARVAGAFGRRGLRLLDCAGTVPDAEFADALHLAPPGTARVHAALLPVAEAFLTRAGALRGP